jgi:aspartyl-tRNA(Asn)/glutamyl-tRNA(Gln) amidotransferase subunit A
MTQLARLTRPFKFLGVPALSAPCGFSPRRMPVGMQLAAKPFAEDVLLRLGHAYQKATEWHAAAPPLHETMLTVRGQPVPLQAFSAATQRSK